ncbi:MAG: TIGR01777 family oxidoreductase [Bacteroidota bacterium]
MDKIVIAGGSGFLGRCLTDYYRDSKELVILSRKKAHISEAKVVLWDGRSLGEWTSELEGAKAVINLSGKSVDCRYTQRNRALIYSSRIDSTQAIGKAIQGCKKPPEVWINSSSATIYRHSLDMPMDESGEMGDGFSVDVCQKWEEAFNAFELPNTRKAIARIAIVLGRKGGALQPLLKLAKFGLGGHQGEGNQMVSWLHQDDFTTMMDYLINSNSLSGIFNLAAPNPVTNKVLMKALREAVGIKFGIPTPTWLLEMGARIIQTETELILKSRYVAPRRMIDNRYQFQFESIGRALPNLL